MLHVNDDTGFTDVVFDPKNPDIVFAGTYQRRRHVGQMIGGGPDGGIWKTTNGGKTWTKLTNGLPPGEVGRIALAVDPKKPGRVYALIDAKIGGGGRGGGVARRAARSAAQPAAAAAAGRRRGRPAAGAARVRPRRRRAAADARADRARRPRPRRAGGPPMPPAPTADDARGFYRSEDAGATWTRMSTYRGGGPAYYSEIFVDPRTPDTIWSINTNFDWSKDGGRTWSQVGVEQSTARLGSGQGSFNVHVDHHDVTFDPDRSEAHHHRQRRRHVRDVRRRPDVAVLRQPADHAVLPRRHRLRRAVLHGLRRHAGQLLDVRAVADVARARHSRRATGI